jgi:hypothetical protein
MSKRGSQTKMKLGKIIGGISENISVGSNENPARFGEVMFRKE